MSSLQGLPPVPKSLTPFLFNQQPKESIKGVANHKPRSGLLPRTPPKDPPPPPPASSLQRKPSSTSSLDSKLKILRREMAGLRQLDMLLMQDLLTLQQSVQDVKMLMNDSSSRSLGSPSSPVDAWELGISFNTGLPLTSVKEDSLSSSTSTISSAEIKA